LIPPRRSRRRQLTEVDKGHDFIIYLRVCRMMQRRGRLAFRLRSRSILPTSGGAAADYGRECRRILPDLRYEFVGAHLIRRVTGATDCLMIRVRGIMG